MSDFRHCQHVFPDGHTCGSVAVTGRDYCYHHLSHRGRRIRTARARSRKQRIYLDLPPLDSLSAIHSAAAQIVEALAADMIDVRHAQAMLSGLRFMARTIAQADKPAWRNNAYQNDQPQSYDNFESDFGLPENCDLTTPPEVAVPSPDPNSMGGPHLPGVGNCGNVNMTTANLPNPPAMPHSGHYCPDHHSTNCDCTVIRADYPVTPEDVEIAEVGETQGWDAAALRSKQLASNWERRQFRSNRKRYEAIALERNMRRAADILAEKKLAAERAPSQDAKSPTPASAAPVSVSSGTSEAEAQPPKKPAARSEEGNAIVENNTTKSSA